MNFFVSVEQPQPFEHPPPLPELNEFFINLKTYHIANPKRNAINIYCTQMLSILIILINDRQ